MIRWPFFAVAVVLVTAAGWENAAEPVDKPRNPFNVEDVPDPDGKDFAADVKVSGHAKNANAERWAVKPTGGSAGNDWIRRTATVKAVGDRLFILYKDNTGTYLIEAKRDGKKLAGRYITVPGSSDTTPWVGKIVDDERIDGMWKEGRWDLRRELPLEKKKD